MAKRDKTGARTSGRPETAQGRMDERAGMPRTRTKTHGACDAA